jgi:hypothetical protein
MSEKASTSTLEAMHDADRHNSGDTASHATESHAQIHGHEHTKPAGDLRDVEFKEDAVKVSRGQTNRGH